MQILKNFLCSNMILKNNYYFDFFINFENFKKINLFFLNRIYFIESNTNDSDFYIDKKSF